MEALFQHLAQQAEQFLLLMAGDQVGDELRTNTARSAVLEMPKFMELISKSFDTDGAMWVVQLRKESLIDKELRDVATLAAPANLLACKSDEEVMHWVAIAGMLIDHTIRAALYAADFRPTFQCRVPAPAAPAESTSPESG